MSLSSRVSGFFLAALAVVLLGFSAALYGFANIYMRRQLDARVASALSVISAAAEFEEDGIEWDPRERVLTLGQDAGPDGLRWRVEGDRGRRVDESSNLRDGSVALDLSRSAGSDELVDRAGRRWAVSRRRLISHVSKPRDGAEEPSERRYASLILTVYAPLDPTRRMLATLGWTLVGLSAGIWTIAALLGRALVRRALRPLTRMVDSARLLDAADSGWMLERAGTGDELDDLGDAFNDLLKRLHLAFQRQRRFSGDASHQLRTPLTALLGQVEVVLRHDRDGDEYRRVLRVVRRQAKNLSQIVEALLFLSRADGETRVSEGEPVELRGWIASFLEDRSPREISERIDYEYGSSCDPIWIRIHPPLFGQLLENLLDNAAKHGDPGALTLVDVQRDGATAVIGVEDHGPGIAAEELAHLFEPFYRSAEARRLGRSGVGLGLAVAQRIAHAFGGSISAKSVLGQGSRFEIRIPLENTAAIHVNPRALNSRIQG